MTASREGSDPDLSALARNLEAAAPGPILTLRCVSGHPVYVLINEQLASGDVMYNWSNTNLPILEIGTPITESTRGKCTSLLYALEAHALGLPLSAATEGPYDIAIETCALIRGCDRFVQDRQRAHFLPTHPAPVRSLIQAIGRSLPSLANSTGHRLAAVMIEADMFPAVRLELREMLVHYFPEVDAVASSIRAADPTSAMNEMMRWIGVSPPGYTYRLDRKAIAKYPRVHVLGSVFDAVLSSTRVNAKNFSLELSHLQKQMQMQWMRPYIGIDHDRTIPPVAIVLGTHISSNEDKGTELFELHARIAGLHQHGTELLMAKGGLSIAFHGA